jgi:PLP dependent protein
VSSGSVSSGGAPGWPGSSGSSASPSAPAAEEVAGRLEEVRARIADAGGDPAAVEVVAVTKGFGPWAVRAALEAGLRSVGENYADELLDKAAAVGDAGVEWHYLGAVQRRKVRRLAPVVSCWQALSRPEEGLAVATAAPGAAVFVEVDITGLPGRPGIAPAEAPALVGALRELGLSVRGLMGVGPPGPADRARSAFRRLAEMAGELGLSEISAGMSEDLEIAVAEGSTMVRVGRALFGDRPLAGHPTH